MASRGETCRFEQLLYGWSESSIFGRRGFGVVAASPGWLPLLPGNDDLLGPVVSYPEPGRRGARPPVHGGFAILRGTPVVFRRIPSDNDALNRPGNYTVQVLLGHGFTVDAALAAGLLAADWLASDLPTPTAQRLPLVDLPKPGPRRGSSAASGAVCGAVLQGLRDNRRVVLAMPSEAEGRAALCDAIRRLPGDLGQRCTFSTLESAPERSGFDIAVAVAGWEASGSGPGAPVLRVDAAGNGLDARSLAWGTALAGASAASLRGIADPVTVAALGTRLDALAKLREDPRSLSPEELLSVLTCPDGQAWAVEPGAPAVAREVIAGMDPALGPRFAKAAQRRPAVTALLNEAGWDALTGTSGPAVEAMLLGLGAQQSDIDMALLAASPGDTLSGSDSERYLRLLRQRNGDIRSDAAASKVQWDARLAAAYPDLWFEAVVGLPSYRGTRATGAVVDGLDVRRMGRVLAAVHADGVAQRDIARRVWAVMPSAKAGQIAFLRRIAASSTTGLGLTFEEILVQPRLDDAVRTALLDEFWPILVRELALPAYLATDLEPAGGVRLSSGTVALLGVAVLALIAAGALLGARLLA